jgi:CheY-like chemotaxis protein
MNNGPNNPAGGSGGKGRRRRRGRRNPSAQPSQGGQGGHQRRAGSPSSPRRAGASGSRPGNRSSAPKFQDAHIYTAPMDHNYRTAENGNGGGRGSRGTRFVHQELEALPASENGAPRIFAFVDDLFFLAKIQETARKLNVKVQFVKSEKEVLDAAAASEQAPSLIIMDLNNASVKPVPTITKLKSKLKKQTNIIGFLSHVQGDLKMKAQEAGCDMVLPRSAFSQNLPQLLRRHGSSTDLQ